MSKISNVSFYRSFYTVRNPCDDNFFINDQRFLMSIGDTHHIINKLSRVMYRSASKNLAFSIRELTDTTYFYLGGGGFGFIY